MAYNLKITEEGNIQVITNGIVSMGQVTKTYDNLGLSHEGALDSVPAAQTGVLTTRTDNDTGVITMDSGGHTIQTGDSVVVFWVVDGLTYRHTMVVGTVSGTTVPIDLGSGASLPSQGTAVIVTPWTVIPFTVSDSGDEMVGLTTSAQYAGLMLFVDSGDAEILNSGQAFGASGGAYIYADSKSSVFPFTGVDTHAVKFANADISNVNIMRVDAVFNPVS